MNFTVIHRCYIILRIENDNKTLNFVYPLYLIHLDYIKMERNMFIEMQFDNIDSVIMGRFTLGGKM